MAGLSPLIMAIRNKDAQIVQTLIAYGADVNKKDGYDNTALMNALFYEDFAISKLLIESGTDVKDDEDLLRFVSKS